MGQKIAARREDEIAVDGEAEVKEILALSEAAEKELESSDPDSEAKSKGILRREFNNLYTKRARTQTQYEYKNDGTLRNKEGKNDKNMTAPKPMVGSKPTRKQQRAEIRAHRLRALTKEVRKGVHTRLEHQLEGLEAELSSTVADGAIGEEDEVRKLRACIRGNRLRKGYIEIVSKALRTSPNILTVQRDVELEMA
ncbi:hypothetical protein LTR56_018452 [Elasticomyces elasticus]|nr:hypothetical protein LTR56_018452 [Elasticomyces elasticus]KAK3631713.1 hypothetical protein LTR22_020951 [Elasticomyces elasticus]KAK4908396.1 hypothetical protein LTR49_022709 [Elasticomyces elasticus]KAK5751724.1 hypothetical protein LTS12_018199 [Elasticomyces elasticus]